MIQSFSGATKEKNDERTRQYKKALKQRSDLNLKYEQAMLENKRNFDAGIPPVPQYKSAEEESRDTANQLIKVRNVLKDYLYSSDVNDVLNRLNTNGELNLFLKFYNQFYQKLNNKKGLSPAEFFAAWDKYKEVLETTDYTGIEEGGINAQSLKELQLGIKENYSYYIYKKFVNDIKDEDDEKLEELFEEIYVKLNKIPGFVIGKDILDGRKISIPIDFNADKYETRTIQYLTDKNKYASDKRGEGVGRFKNNVMIPYIAYHLYDENIIKYIEDNFPDIKPEDVYQRKALPENKITVNMIRGSGVATFRIDYSKQNNFGTEATLGCPSLPRYIQIGEYDLHAYRLDDNIVSIHAKSSHKRTKAMEMFKCSDLFREMLLDLLYEKQILKSDYDKLSDDEVEKLHRVAKLCRLPMREVLGKNNKRIIEASGDKDSKRFEVLKGEILAGNNSPELIKELKMLLFKLNSQGVVSKDNFDELMEIILSL